MSSNMSFFTDLRLDKVWDCIRWLERSLQKMRYGKENSYEILKNLLKQRFKYTINLYILDL